MVISFLLHPVNPLRGIQLDIYNFLQYFIAYGEKITRIPAFSMRFLADALNDRALDGTAGKEMAIR